MIFFFDTNLYPIKKYDYDTDRNLIYEGFSSISSDIEDTVWIILKYIYDSVGNNVAIRVSNGEIRFDKRWVDRKKYYYTNPINTIPIIDNLIWDDDSHYTNSNYTLTINAHDPDANDTLTYEIICDDNNVNIVQDTTNENIFHITYPNYSINNTVNYTITVTDNNGLATTSVIDKLVQIDNSAPIIDNIIWDNNDHHRNYTYILTINAHDPDIGDILTYEIICDDNNVNIVQNTTNENIFYITYPNYNIDTTVNYTITVTDNDEVTTSITDTKLISINLVIGDVGVFSGGDFNDNYSSMISYLSISILSNTMTFGNLTISNAYLSSTSNGTNNRGIFAGGYTNDYTDIITYITISSLGNADNFGKLRIKRCDLAAISNGVNERGVFGGGGTDHGHLVDKLDYITISSLVNALDFGKLTTIKDTLTGVSNNINDRGIFGGGYINNQTNIIDYITISNLGNAINFGDLTIARYGLASNSNGANDRGIFGGGYNGNYLNTIDYITISTLNNALNFGDLTIIRRYFASTSNGTNNRGIFSGGYDGHNYLNTIDYITISTLGNALNFGDLSTTIAGLAATSNI